MTPARLGASLTCATPSPGKPNSDARTPHSMHIRNLILRSLLLLIAQDEVDSRHSVLLHQRRIGPLSIRDTSRLAAPPEYSNAIIAVRIMDASIRNQC